MDPLAISTGQGKGLAQVLPQSNITPYSIYADYADAKAKEAQAGKLQQQKAMKDLEDIEVGGFVKDTQRLYDIKNELSAELRDNLIKTGGKYNYAVDEKFTRKLNRFKALNKSSNDIKELFKTEYGKLQAGKDQWDPQSVEEVTAFYNLPMEERYEYVKDKDVPTLRPKPKVINYVEDISKYDIPYATTEFETGVKDGRIGTQFTKKVNEAALEDQAQRYWNLGQNNASEGALKLFEVISAKVDSNPNTELMTPEERGDAIMRAFKEEYKKIKLSQAEKVTKIGSKSAGDDSGFSFGPGGNLQSDKYVYVLDEEEKDGKDISVYKDYKWGTEKKPSYIVTTITPTPKKGGVNKPDNYITKDGTSLILSPERAFKGEDGEWYVSGIDQYKIKRVVPYKGNEGTWDGTFDDSPDELLKNMNQGNRITTGQGAGPEKAKSKKKTYTKAELEKKAKDAGYSYDEYYDLVKDKIELSK